MQDKRKRRKIKTNSDHVSGQTRMKRFSYSKIIIEN